MLGTIRHHKWCTWVWRHCTNKEHSRSYILFLEVVVLTTTVLSISCQNWIKVPFVPLSRLTRRWGASSDPAFWSHQGERRKRAQYSSSNNGFKNLKQNFPSSHRFHVREIKYLCKIESIVCLTLLTPFTLLINNNNYDNNAYARDCNEG